MQDVTKSPDDKSDPAPNSPGAINDAARAAMVSTAKVHDEQGLSELLRARCPAIVRALVETVAQIQGITPSEYIRRSVVGSLQADGLKVSPTAGELYDSRIERGKAQQRYAWVEGDQIKAVSYHDAKPEQDGRTWLPVVHVDSEPFDIVRHWRLAPVFTIEADRVVCTYPVVSKSEAI
jgi:hypothetical protein